MGTAEVRLPGAGVRWSVKDRTLDYADQLPLIVDESSRIEAAMRRAEAEAFAFSDRDVLARLIPHLQSGPLRLDSLPIENALDVVVALHAVGAARSSEGKEFVRARKLDVGFDTPFFSADNYELLAHSAVGDEPPVDEIGSEHD
jgi:hypothetical protein